MRCLICTHRLPQGPWRHQVCPRCMGAATAGVYVPQAPEPMSGAVLGFLALAAAVIAWGVVAVWLAGRP